MPNPDFTGTVPSRRCETCEFWCGFTSVDGHVGAGTCQQKNNQDRRYAPILTVTTDLSVCSNWSRKEE